MKLLVVRVGIFFLKIIYEPIKLLKVKKKIVYISREYNHESLDFRLLREEINKRDVDIIQVVLAKKLEKGIIEKIKYIFHMFRQMYHIATSKIVILDTYCIVISVLNHKKETKIIQMWHATSCIKKFGYQTIGKKSGCDASLAKIMKMHNNYDYILCSSNITKKNYMKAFNVDSSRIKMIGLPKISFILDDDKSEEIYRKYPILNNKKKNILYAPTFRKNEDINIDEIINKINLNKYNLIIKLHPLERKKHDIEEKEGIIVDNIFSCYDMFVVCDKVISDYSSLIVDAALLNKEIYFYTYDIDKYKKDPGLNINFKKEKIGYYQTSNIDKLIKLLDEKYNYDYLNDFKKRYFNIDVKNSLDELADFVISLLCKEV